MPGCEEGTVAIPGSVGTTERLTGGRSVSIWAFDSWMGPKHGDGLPGAWGNNQASCR